MDSVAIVETGAVAVEVEEVNLGAEAEEMVGETLAVGEVSLEAVETLGAEEEEEEEEVGVFEEIEADSGEIEADLEVTEVVGVVEGAAAVAHRRLRHLRKTHLSQRQCCTNSIVETPSHKIQRLRKLKMLCIHLEKRLSTSAD